MVGGAAGRATGAEASPSIATAAARALMPAMARSRSLLMFAVTCDMRRSSIMDVRSYGGSDAVEADEADTAPAVLLLLLERSAFLRRGDEDRSGGAGAVSAASAAAAALAASTAAATAAARSVA